MWPEQPRLEGTVRPLRPGVPAVLAGLVLPSRLEALADSAVPVRPMHPEVPAVLAGLVLPLVASAPCRPGAYHRVYRVADVLSDFIRCGGTCHAEALTQQAHSRPGCNQLFCRKVGILNRQKSALSQSF